VEATRPESELVVDSVRRKIVEPRMHQAAVVPRKMTAIASMRLIIGMCLEGELPPLQQTMDELVSIVKYFLL
jgi:hypothetical protein